MYTGYVCWISTIHETKNARTMSCFLGFAVLCEVQKYVLMYCLCVLQTELVKMKAGFAKERQQFQRDIATKDVTIKTQQVLCVSMLV